jgi:hypothetical protein
MILDYSTSILDKRDASSQDMMRFATTHYS